MKKLLQSLLNSGVQPEQPAYLQRKIRMANIVALVILFGNVLPFMTIGWFYFRPMTQGGIAGIFVCLGVILLNRVGVTTLSRCLLATIPTLASSINHAQLVGVDEPAIPALYMFTLSSALLPFLLFDLREKAYLLVLTVFDVATILSFDLLNMAFEIEGASGDVLVNGPPLLVKSFQSLSIMLALLNVFLLVNQNQTSERQSEKLLTEAQENQQQMEAARQEAEENLTKVQESQKKEQLRQWISEGLSQANQLIRTHNNTTDLGDALIRFVVTYLRANQGGFFVVNGEGEETTIDLVSAYAYERKKFVEKSIRVGQGLVGQTYREGKYTYLTSLPADYVNITSGLGEATPNALIVMPLRVEDTVVGMLELASFQAFSEHDIEFLEKVSESLASSIRSTQMNETTQRLLLQAQEQTEGMRAQEEEMRQNMEELSATQEEMHRKEQAYLQEIESLRGQLAAFSQS